MENRHIPVMFFILLVSFASIGAVIPSASLVTLSKYFKITTNEAEGVISFFVLGYAISQLLYGYIAHTYGRKQALYIGTTLALIGYAICYFANSYNLLLIGRFISALGSGCGLTVTFTLIADLYKGNEAKKITSYTTSAFAVMPGLAILIGSLLSSYYSWRACFIFMLLYSFLVLAIVTKIPTLAPHKATDGVKWSDYVYDFKEYSYAAVIWGLCGGIIYMLSSTLPIITINEFHISTSTFGILYSSSMLGYFVGNILSAKLNSKLSTWKVLYAGCFVNMVAAFLFVIVSYFDNITIYYMPIFLLFLSLPMIFSTLLGQSMQKVKNKAISSCITSFTCMALSAIISMAVSSISSDLHHKETFITFSICLIITILTISYIKNKAHDCLIDEIECK